MREFMCISTVRYNPAFPEFNNTPVPVDACYGKIVNATGEHNVVYLSNRTACILNLPPDLRARLIQQMDDDFTTSPIDCHIQFENEEWGSAVTAYVMLALLLFSILCLVMTIVVYVLKREIASVPGLNLTCLCLSHLVHFIAGVCNLLNLPKVTVSRGGCTLFGFTRHFTILATFFWLNVMAFDIWRTITNMTCGSSNGRKVFKWKLFAKYSAYAWGLALFFAVMAIIVDSIDGIPQKYKPGYEPPSITDPDLRCTMSINNTKGFFIFNTGPRIIVLIVNVVFFVLTAKAIHTTSKQAEAIRSTNRVKARFRLYIKLFLVMGLAWILNLCDFIIHVRLGADWVFDGPRWFNVLTTYVTILNGVGIYLTFGLVPTIKMIRDKCCSKVKIRPRSQLTVCDSLPYSRSSGCKELRTVSTKL